MWNFEFTLKAWVEFIFRAADVSEWGSLIVSFWTVVFFFFFCTSRLDVSLCDIVDGNSEVSLLRTFGCFGIFCVVEHFW